MISIYSLLLIICAWNVILTQKLKITSQNLSYNIGVSTFGNIPYGSSIVGSLLYKFDDVDREIACKSLFIQEFNQNYTSIDLSSKSSFMQTSYRPSNFLMLDRGSCTFVTKARNAQYARADALIIVDNVNEPAEDVYMIDDGSGDDIYIPSVIINRNDGQKIKQLLLEGPLTIELEFPVEKTDEVYFEVVMSSSNKEMYDLLYQLRSLITSFKSDEFAFYPVYYSQTHPFLGIPSPAGEKSEYQDCYYKGKYCFFLDEEAISMGITDGRTVLKENIRQICIFRARETERNFNLFLDYIEMFYSNCIMKQTFDDKCSLSVLKKIDKSEEHIKQINDCVESSFKDDDNFYLQKEKEFQKKMNVIVTPSIIVNRKLIYGKHSAFNIMEAICMSFNKPGELCESIGFGSSNKLVNGRQETDDSIIKKSGLSGKAVALIVVSIILINILIIIACRIYLKKKMLARMEASSLEDKISSTVTNYMALREK